MSKKVRCIVISGYGTNCEVEMAYACKLAGGEVDIVHISELLYGEKRLDDYHFLNFPGGFLDGDDLGAAKAAANRWRFARVKKTGELLFDQLLRFIKDGKLILGVCNGFQLMVKLGLLPGFSRYDEQLVTLTYNDSSRFEDRWVYLKVDKETPCIFTKGIEKLYLPIRHGEGKFIAKNNEILKSIENSHLAVVKYIDPKTDNPTMEYPYNPNGSINAIAGICDSTGRLFGLMPHPEAYLHYTNHPQWTREKLPEEGMGLMIFRNAIEYIKENLL
ncbi:MAG: phosphoribosylformylglycinamidine synthase subunit PurQ [Candidatus Desulfofervidus auxilii]|nr:phosphoribosylformylglycinamidine synthase subunit PurQ [Candidatus Desulfofervidus auxilii]